MKRPATVALVLAITVMFLSACAPTSIADGSYRGEIEPSAEADEPFSGQPRIGWIERNKRFALTIWGSSSCPSIPTSIKAEANNAITIHFEQSPRDSCTADMAATTYEFTVPSGSGATPLTVILEFPPQGGTYPMILE